MNHTFDIKILILAYGVSTFSEGIIMPVYAFYVQHVGGGVLETTWAISVFLLMSGITTLTFHRQHWINKYNTQLLICGWLIWATGVFLYLLVSDFKTLLICQILLAIGNAIANPIFDQELAEQSISKTKLNIWGTFEGSQDIFNGLAAIIGGLIVTTIGFFGLIHIMVATATISLLLLLLYLRGKTKQLPL